MKECGRCWGVLAAAIYLAKHRKHNSLAVSFRRVTNEDRIREWNSKMRLASGRG